MRNRKNTDVVDTSANVTDSGFDLIAAGRLFARATRVPDPIDSVEEDDCETLDLAGAAEIYRAAVEAEQRAAAKLAQAQEAYNAAQELADEASELLLELATTSRG